jgi:hypothetical protein
VDLSFANLTGSNFSGANFTQAKFHETVFGNTNLSNVKGLNTCEHRGPSIIDHRTLADSGSHSHSLFCEGAAFPTGSLITCRRF